VAQGTVRRRSRIIIERAGGMIPLNASTDDWLGKEKAFMVDDE
jgi:hypothetical protein